MFQKQPIVSVVDMVANEQIPTFLFSFIFLYELKIDLSPVREQRLLVF